VGIVQHRCLGPCHELKDVEEFRVLYVRKDKRTGRPIKTRDVYCKVCSPNITPAQRRADTKDFRPPDR
jgi:hypothetical protein